MIIISNPEVSFRKKLENSQTLIFNYKTDYIDYSITFDKKLKCWYLSVKEWFDNEEGTFVPMNERGSDWSKHCAKYGYWQSTLNVGINLELHNFINNIIKELGW